MNRIPALRSITLPAAFMAAAGFAQLPVVDISLEHDQPNSQLLVHLRANDFDFGELLSNLVFTVRWQESSAATLSFGTSNWCPAPSAAFSPAPSAMVTPGNGFKYRTWNSVGLALLSDIQDDGGCNQTMLANTWTHVLTIPVSNDPGGTVFEIAVDQYALDNNRGFFVSLNGLASTGEVYSISTEVPELVDARETLAIAPNPTNNLVSIHWPEDGAWVLEVYDSTGRMLQRSRYSGTLGMFSAEGMAIGSYEMRVLGSGAMRTATMVVVR